MLWKTPQRFQEADILRRTMDLPWSLAAQTQQTGICTASVSWYTGHPTVHVPHPIAATAPITVSIETTMPIVLVHHITRYHRCCNAVRREQRLYWSNEYRSLTTYDITDQICDACMRELWQAAAGVVARESDGEEELD